MRVIWLSFKSLLSSWCCVPSPQSKSQTSPLCGRRSATHETFRERVGTPALVPRKVICKVSNPNLFVYGGELPQANIQSYTSSV
jgi:hypothetical protein